MLVIKVVNSQWFIRFLGLVLVLCLTGIALNYYGKYRLNRIIKKQLPRNIKVSYETISLNLFQSQIELKNISVEYLKKEDTSQIISIDAKQLNCDGIDLIRLWKEKKFSTHTVHLNEATIKYTKEDSLLFSLPKTRVTFTDFETDSILASHKIPFRYETVSLLAENLEMVLNEFEVLTLEKVSLNNSILNATNLSISSRYSKAGLSKKLKVEHDYIDLKIPKIKVSDFSLESRSDSLVLESRIATIENVKLALYRDKMLPDDTKPKVMYGQMLSNLPIKIDLDTVLINSGHITYAEKLTNKVEPEPLLFTKLNASIYNLSNRRHNNVKVDVKTHLMNDAPLQLKWNFNVDTNKSDFQASVSLSNLETEAINPFLITNAKVKTEGFLNEMYFTIYGNNESSKGDIKMRYKNFEISLLDDDRSSPKKIISAFANLFVSKNSKTDGKNYRYGSIDVERDATKSFFNYLWLNTRDGLKAVVLGNGKKEN